MDKTCTRCKTSKDISEFSPLARGGHYSICRSCKNAAREQWRLANPQRVAQSKRRAKLRRKYGLSTEQHETLVARSACAVCGTDSVGVRRVGDKHLVVCARCSGGLGAFGDDPALLRAAAALLA